MKKRISIILTLALAASLFTGACSGTAETGGTDSSGAESETAVSDAESGTEASEGLASLNAEQKEATEYTAEINSAYYDELDFDDDTEYEFATYGLIDAPETLELTDDEGNVVWSQDAYDFLDYDEEAADSVNPGLWRNASLNHLYGLYEVTEGIYQVRGYDMANLTVIATDTGWVVFDTTMTEECAAAAMQLIEKNLGERPVKAVIISHSHVDHYGGIGGVISEDELADASLSIEEQLASGKVPVIVPEGFLENVASENVYVGTAMSRRALYQYGSLLDADEQGSVSVGIGTGQSTGTVTFYEPTWEITETGETITIDGLEIEFELTPGTEAPSEMNAYFPQMKALWMAENCTATLHNLYTLRGAQVRDGNEWAKYINEAKTLYGDEAEVVFQSHNWPHFGNEFVNEYLTNTAAVYKYINDRTLMYINQGYTSDEISNMIELPETLSKIWYTRQYYGTVAHNAKAVYQKYMGWYDGNPVNLDPLTPTESAEKWVEYLGDTDKVLEMALEDYENGEYQWVAEVTNVLVYADPDNLEARYLCADALEQLGYQSESGAWRNAYLTAAYELRNTDEEVSANSATQSATLRQSLTGEMMLDYLGIMTSTEQAEDVDFMVNLYMQDVDEQYLLHFYHGVLLYYSDTTSDAAVATLTGNKAGLYTIISKNAEAAAEAFVVEGDEGVLQDMIDLVGEFDKTFNIVEP
ncbi:MAG: MBL fold metallo-hydrolase [Lachnospiraceae bacterium]|nr:MBL fold metallo-hydrolase [Lachnospiraceae bacterium]